MRIAIAGKKREEIQLPLYKMVRELAKRVHTQKGITRFNSLPFLDQLDYFDTPIEDAADWRILAAKVHPGELSRISTATQTHRRCERTSGSYTTFLSQFFINGDKGIYLHATIIDRELALTPRISIKRGLYISDSWMRPSFGTRRRRTLQSREDLSLNHNGYEGHYRLNDPRGYPYEIQEVVPSLGLNIRRKGEDREAIEMLREAVAESA